MNSKVKWSKRLMVVVVFLSMAVVARAATLQYDGSTDDDWSKADNWSIYPGPVALGSTPWDAPSAPADDISIAANMTVNSTQTYTTGPNVGTPFMIRRIGMVGGKKITIVDGGTLNFSGATDAKIDLTNTGSTLIMTGGKLICTQSNLKGLNLVGSGAYCEIGSNSVVDIRDARTHSSYDPGINFNTATSARALHIKGSSASIILEQLRLSTGTNEELRFTLDSGGASSVGVEMQLDMSNAGVQLTILNPGGAFSGLQTLLFNLDNGSLGTFDSVVTDVGTFSGADGTTVTLGGGKSYELTYDYNGSGGIGLTTAAPAGTVINIK